VESPPIFFITGAPATGKSTLSKALLLRFLFGIHVPVDELRELVVSGIAHPVGWTDETTRQFRLAEQSACDLAVRYQDAGFAVAVDHCQGPPTLDALIAERLPGRVVHKIALVSSLETNLRRNRERTNKTFDHSVLIGAIEKLSPLYRSEPIGDQGWIVFSNEEDDVEAAVDRLLSQLGYSITK
jgi:hypothetical protein